MEWTESMKKVLQETAKTLKGASRRRFMGQIVLELGHGGQSKVERELGWNRGTIRKGIYEITSGITQKDNFCARGRKRAEWHLPNLLKDIRAIVDCNSQTDPSYQRFIEWMPSTLIPLCAYLKRCFGSCTGIGFVDATSLKVCQHGGCISWGNPSIPHRHNRRIKRHKVFDGLAARGKTSVDWFFGFKLHLVVNEIGQLLNVHLTPGNVDDRRPVPDLLQGLFGKIFADRGYVSQQLATQLLEELGIQFFAKPRRNMKNKLMCLHDKLLSRQRSIIETINDQLKNISQIEHSRHRSPVNFCVNVLCGLIAYCHQPKKPSLRLDWLLPQSH